MLDRILESYGIGLGVLILGMMLHFHTAWVALPYYAGIGLAGSGLVALASPRAARDYLRRRQPLGWAAPFLETGVALVWVTVIGCLFLALGLTAIWSAWNGAFVRT